MPSTYLTCRCGEKLNLEKGECEHHRKKGQCDNVQCEFHKWFGKFKMINQLNFTIRLIKGKIAEIIFQQMFSEAGEFTVLRLGYEYTSPELAQYQDRFEVKQVIETIRNTPDFALISHDKKRVFIVEVKYRTSFKLKELERIAHNTLKFANPSWLFVATPEGFYFDACHNVENHEGDINQLGAKWIRKDLQEKYLNLLREFEK